MFDADFIDVFKHRRAAAAHQLHGSAIAALAESQQQFDHIDEIERNIEKYQIGLARGADRAQRRSVCELNSVDPETVQNQ